MDSFYCSLDAWPEKLVRSVVVYAILLAAFRLTGKGEGGVPYPESGKVFDISTFQTRHRASRCDSLTSAKLLADIDTDAPLAAPQDRCTVLRALAERSTVLDKEGYAKRCPQYPFDEYPGR